MELSQRVRTAVKRNSSNNSSTYIWVPLIKYIHLHLHVSVFISMDRFVKNYFKIAVYLNKYIVRIYVRQHSKNLTCACK